ncbi:hypothetical protein HK104_008917 [Borealophlyctis nickersoniae]|nr:hypothetical protein HK104_008917 [Borealophlyctis nickersoniae]
MARVPASSNLNPPPASDCSRTIEAFIHNLQQTEAPDGFGIILGVELVMNLVEVAILLVHGSSASVPTLIFHSLGHQRLLKCVWDADRTDVRTALESALNAASSILIPSNREHRKAQLKMGELFEELEKPWTVRLQTVSSDQTENLAELESGPLTVVSHSQWRDATVKWLTTIDLFQPVKLPKMKSTGIYGSRDEYFDTVLKLWVAMTFHDGNNAVSPVCKHRDNDKECGHVMWPNPKSSSDVRCRTRNCANGAVLVCGNRFHNLGLCETCAIKAQNALRGPPGRDASTHIYDGTVTKVNFDANIYINEVQSRRPPQTQIHWRTTRRLQCPNLVGIVKLSSRGAMLRLDSKIYWGELTSHAWGVHEDKMREQGKLAVSLLSMDDAFLSDMDVDIQQGDRVAIIDCQTFVPEFFPVLKALEAQNKSVLPFKNGELLNLSPRSSIITPLRDVEEGSSSYVPIEEISDADVQIADLQRCITLMVDESELDPIVQIRRDDGGRRELIDRLCLLVKKATLDPGQFESFIGALKHPVHCTQGPPGTGKSYSGVIIVRALMRIRELWMRYCPSVGRPPILVLSYKNHAIDEFLSDLHSAEAPLSMIRIGGSCSDPRLQNYLESNFTQSNWEVKGAKMQLATLHQQKLGLKDFLSSFGKLECAKADIFDYNDSDEQKVNRRRAGHEAAETLGSLVGWVTGITASTEGFWENNAAGSRAEGWAGSLKYEAIRRTVETAAEQSGRYVLKPEDIKQLFDGIRHYTKKGDPHLPIEEILFRWLLGFKPLPQCRCTEGSEDKGTVACDGISMTNSLYCDQHRCFQEEPAADGELARCRNAILPTNYYCAQHACAAENCISLRIPNSEQVYCQFHACFVCLSFEKVVAGMANDDPPRHTCDLHPLCQALGAEGTLCPNLAVSGTPFCENHQATKCSGTTKAGRPCRGRAISRAMPFCNEHRHQYRPEKPGRMVSDWPELEMDESYIDVASLTCGARTTKGKPCKGKVITGSKFCVNHQSKEQGADSWLAGDQVAPAAPKSAPAAAGTPSSEAPNLSNSATPPEIQQQPVSLLTEIDRDDDILSLGSSLSDGDISEIEDVERVHHDNADEVEESEHLQHLRDVYQIAQEEAHDFGQHEDAESEEESTTVEHQSSGAVAWVSPAQWTWDMTIEERWKVCHAFMDLASFLCSNVFKVLATEIESCRRDYHQAKLRANTQVYEGKSIIGGTIVGCIARLSAIRATKPFAILVEEASEVLEPLLFAALGSTTCKLEMIGDHLQLQPSMMAKFEFEKINKMNVSMFERLVTAPKGYQVPYAVLSVQRRMRTNIADLTRDFYCDITAIKDHSRVHTQVIGGRLPRRHGYQNQITKVEGRGREIPGVQPHIYFWTHTGTQEKASVGLSKVNPAEASMVCKLAQYLVGCGVPNRSIAILTPYKGQLMLLRKQLGSSVFSAKDPVNSCLISTVDRFQGDEADVVIISLVIDSKSRTPFVKLVNRMIVLLSRARVGMYIVGNVDYFGDNPVQHWAKTLEKLREPAATDSDEQALVVYSGSRVGAELPLCCPLHRQVSTTVARKAADLKLGFCKEHEVTGTCSQISGYENTPMSVPKCVKKVEYMPQHCAHAITVDCCLKQLYEQGQATFTCAQKVSLDLPRCGHPASVPCQVAVGLRSWNGRANPLLGVVTEGSEYGPVDYVCKMEAELHRLCGHTLKTTCEKAFMLASRKPPCEEKEEIVNPACGHPYLASCFEKQRVQKDYADWRNGLEAIAVFEESKSNALFKGNVLSGQCRHAVLLRRSCGHEQKLECCAAQNMTTKCKVQVETTSPLCGHMVSVVCSNKDFGGFTPWSLSVMESESFTLLMGENILEDTFPPPLGNIPPVLGRCNAMLTLKLKSGCGHTFNMKCADAFTFLTKGKSRQTLPTCHSKVKRVLECGHEHEFQCHEYDRYLKDPAKFKCTEIVRKRCWNFKACGQQVDVPCWSKSTPCCSLETPWQCEHGHVYQLKQCVDGYPSHCPQCSMDLLDEELELAERRAEASSEALSHAPALFPVLQEVSLNEAKLCCTQDSVRRYFDNQATLLTNYKTWAADLQEWKRPVFRPHHIRGFTIARGNPNQKDLPFRPSATTMNGIQVIEWTADNLKKVKENCRDAALQIFVIEAFACRVLVHPKDIPKVTVNQRGKRRNQNNPLPELGKWVKRQKDLGYDAMQYQFQGLSCVVFWEPYCLYPTHRVTLSKTTLEQLASRLGQSDHQNTLYQSQTIVFRNPIVTSELSVVPSVLDAPKVAAITEALQGTFAAGIPIAAGWTFEALGLPHTLQPSLDRELSTKLLFLRKSTADGAPNPYAGIKCLGQIASQCECAELDLFFSLEFLHLDRIKEAKERLEKYISGVRERDAEAHPLLLLALGRLHYAEKADETLCWQLVHAFSSINDKAMDFISQVEAERLKQPRNKGKVARIGISPVAATPVEIWEELKVKENCKSDAMEQLLKLTGLKKVKQAAVQLFTSAIAFKKLPVKKRKANSLTLHYCFFGNPGTGKTTVARLFAQILHDSGLREKSTFTECTAQTLKDEGPDKFRKQIAAAKGGVLFIDEAYELNPVGDFKGKPIVAELLTASENMRHELSIILAGYEEDMNKQFFAYNDGLRSRFESIIFEDFDEADLLIIWHGMLEERGWTASEQLGKMVVKKLAKSSGRKGFGNARAVRQKLEEACKKAMGRDGFDGTMEILIKDAVGDNPLHNPKLKSVLDEYEEKIGWKSIKETVKQFVAVCQNNYERELQGLPPVPIFLNRLFLGNPGTGKTTCASLYGRLLKNLNFLSIGAVVSKTASDFVGSHVGESQTKTSAILDEARGKVLLIDEAYNLDDNMYGKQVLDVLVEKVSGSETDDIAVLLLGYEEPMLTMLRNQNPGLARRFPREYAFMFEDYSEFELLHIFQYACRRNNVTASYLVDEKAIAVLVKQKALPNFGNAGAVNTLLTNAIARATARQETAGEIVLIPEDLEAGTSNAGKGKKAGGDPLAPLDELYRMSRVKEELVKLQNAFKVAEMEGTALPDVGHFVFRGSPGTGKTTVARVCATILHNLGILTCDKLVETSGLDLQGQYLGQTKKRVEEKLGEARGGVLFIDEAYSLGEGHYGTEAMTTLVAAMTDPTYKGLVIIIAGYPRDIDEMLDRNAGLKSRFSRFIEFEDWATEDAMSFIESQMCKENYVPQEDVLSVLRRGFDELRGLPGWGNGRDVTKLWKETLIARAGRVINVPETEKTVATEDVQTALTALLNARRTPGGERLSKVSSWAGALPDFRGMEKSPPKHETRKVTAEVANNDEQVKQGSPTDGRDPGVSDEDWAELEKAKEEYAQEMKHIQNEMEEEARQEEIRKQVRYQIRIVIGSLAAEKLAESKGPHKSLDSTNVECWTEQQERL